MSDDYTAIDFVQMYMNRIPNEPEFDRLDDMLRAAAVLTVEADKVLEDLTPGYLPDEGGE